MSSVAKSSAEVPGKARVMPAEETAPLVGARDLEAHEPKAESGQSLIPKSLFKGLKDAATILISSLGFAAVLRAFWLWERGVLATGGLWCVVLLSFLATCTVMAIFQVSMGGYIKAWGKMIVYSISLGMIFFFGSILAFVGLFWFRYNFDLVGKGSRSLSAAWNLLRSDPGACWKRIGMGIATIVLAPITAIPVGFLTIAMQADEEVSFDREFARRVIKSPSGLSAIFLSVALPAVCVAWKISALEGFVFVLLGTLLLLGFLFALGDFDDRPTLSLLTALSIILVPVLFKLVPIVTCILCALGILYAVFQAHNEERAASHLLSRVLSAALLFGGAGVLLGDVLSPSRLQSIVVPNLMATASNITGGIAWVPMPPLNPEHPSLLPAAEKAHRAAFWPTLLLGEGLLTLVVLLGILIGGQRVAEGLLPKSQARLSQDGLTFVSCSAMRALLCVCLEVQLVEALAGTHFLAGLLWEGYFVLLTAGILWQLFQAALLLAAQPSSQWGAMSILSALVAGIGPLVSDAFDQIKDVQFCIIALSSGNPIGEVLGLISFAYLFLYTEHTAYSPELSSELATGYLTLWVMNPKQEAPAGEPGSLCPASCQELLEGAVPWGLFTAYKQSRPHRLEFLIVEDVVQASISLLFLALTGKAPLVVVILNLGLPLCRLLFILFLHRFLLFQVGEKIAEEVILAAAAGRTGVAVQWVIELASGPKVPKEKLEALLAKHHEKLLRWKRQGLHLLDQEHLDQRPAIFFQEHLKLSDAALGDGFCLVLCLAVMGGSPLKTLDLGRNSIGVEGAKALAEALRHSRLEKLDLGRNSIGDEGAKALAEALRHSQLEKLDLRWNSIGVEGAKALAEALPHSRLEKLSLGRNSIRVEGAKALAEALRHSQLKELYLWENSIGDKGAKALAEALRHSQLEKLDLGRNSIGEEGGKALEEKQPEGLQLRL